MEIVSAFGPLKSYHFETSDSGEPRAFLEVIQQCLCSDNLSLRVLYLSASTMLSLHLDVFFSLLPEIHLDAFVVPHFGVHSTLLNLHLLQIILNAFTCVYFHYLKPLSYVHQFNSSKLFLVEHLIDYLIGTSAWTFRLCGLFIAFVHSLYSSINYVGLFGRVPFFSNLLMCVG